RSHPDIGSIEKSSAPSWQCCLRVIAGIVGPNKDLVEIAMGGASAAVDADLAGDVATADVGLGGGVYHAELAGVGLAAIFRALHEDLRCGAEVVILHVNVAGIVQTIEPHAVVKGNCRGGGVRLAESIGAIGRVTAGDFSRREADHGQVGNV